MNQSKVVIIGGGLAGLTAAIHLRKLNIPVALIEKNSYPKHKVCGEYLSNEVLPYWQWLNISIEELKPTHINQLQFSTVSGKTINTNLPLGGFGVSRYALDYYLYQKAIADGCEIVHESIEKIHFTDDVFTITTATETIIKSKIVLGAFGKRSNIDIQLNRNFIQKKSPWLAVKAHYNGDFPNEVVGLHNFKGGYCGVSKVEDNRINICYLASYETFKKHRDSDLYQKEVLEQNPHLKNIFQSTKLLFEKPLTISQISFEQKRPVESHILMIGDTAGLIHPLCGNGMAMAIHSAKIAAEVIDDFLKEKIKSRTALEQIYAQHWNKNFKRRLRIGRLLSNILLRPKLSNMAFRIVMIAPFLLPMIIKKTHGKPIKISA
ncbi:NAD(P)/FAD-dependent oxidoreductase [Flavobacterium sp. J49]|uniref:NAD(P)/FAD-dependent oxidoreductase n=1 Tax=Flavobacterium sp. J49 TaxID=2718534 RepID=UPI00159468E9|nr:NAD(P)/FAD-dependent oxidoreductase [Flavobacterium sp. J49]MBF6642094.1 NAD(P)/FAD-dependent oxidoreductase [Flavobacterium sp. J49]NIC03341.1 NAD(P)/FAD-dependent oxidoreductase [Flavobacterium sp. J49]